MFALDLDDSPDPEGRTSHFGEPRATQFAFRLPGYAREPVDVFRVNGDGVYDVDWETKEEGVRVRDRRSRLEIYVATREPKLRDELRGRHLSLLESETAGEGRPCTE